MLILVPLMINPDNMKKNSVRLLSMVLLLSFAFACKSGGGPQKPEQKELEIPSELKAAFNEDAHRLALREFNSKTQLENSAELPKDRVKYYMDLLVRCWQKWNSDPEIPNLDHIHTLPRPNMQTLQLVLTKDSPYKDNWSQRRTMTGNLYLNQLLSQYQMSIKEYRESSIGPMVRMTSKRFINTPELAMLLGKIEGIKIAETAGFAGDGNDITYGPDGKNAVSIRFSIGAGDCPSGCIHRKYYVFYVNQDQSLQYMGTRGEIPEDVKRQEGIED